MRNDQTVKKKKKNKTGLSGKNKTNMYIVKR